MLQLAPMSLLTMINILLPVCALMAYANYRLFKLPTTIGVMLVALLISLAMLLLGAAGLPLVELAERFVAEIDFDEVVLHGMLSFLLFAGALHVNLDDLKAQRWTIGLLAFVGTMISTALVGTSIYYLLGWIGLAIPFIYALLFGALISPTDPVAVLAILRNAGIKKSLETKVVGESLFNDGIGVVVFLVLLGIATGDPSEALSQAPLLFVQEVLGGIVTGFVLGYVTFLLLRSVDNYQLEILLTLALVAGGYELCHALHLSGPIAMVVAGLLIGNHGRSFAMSDTTRTHLDQFWELMDELLNIVLFVLLGMELLILDLHQTAIFAGLLTIPIVLTARLIAVSIPVSLLKLKREFSPRVIPILTWGGLRGGISVALALSLPESDARDTILVITYAVVVFSILIQGLTINRLVRNA